MKIDIVTIFPDFFRVLDESLLGKAQEKGIVAIDVHDLRDVTTDRHRTVDDTPYGGGAGMVMRADVWGRMLDQLVAPGSDTVLAIPTPTGKRFTQRDAEKLAQAEHIVFACGRYEGIDSRVAANYAANVWEFSLGDYVLNGGESAALVAIEAVTRLLDGAVGNPESVVEESHSSEGLLEYDIFTKPAMWRGREVPAVLLSGNHERIAQWRRENALQKTALRRPDMVAQLAWEKLTGSDREVLAACGFADAHTRVSFAYAPSDHAASCEIGAPISAEFQELSLLDLFTGTSELAKMPADGLVVCAHTDTAVLAYAQLLRPSAPQYPSVLRSDKFPASALLTELSCAGAFLESGVPGALVEAIAELGAKIWPDLNEILLLRSDCAQFGEKSFWRQHRFKRAGKRVRTGETGRAVEIYRRDVSHLESA